MLSLALRTKAKTLCTTNGKLVSTMNWKICRDNLHTLTSNVKCSLCPTDNVRLQISTGIYTSLSGCSLHKVQICTLHSHQKHPCDGCELLTVFEFLPLVKKTFFQTLSHDNGLYSTWEQATTVGSYQICITCTCDLCTAAADVQPVTVACTTYVAISRWLWGTGILNLQYIF